VRLRKFEKSVDENPRYIIDYGIEYL